MISKVHTFGKTASKRLYFIGLGKEKDLTFELLREIFGTAFKVIKAARLEEAALYLDSFLTENIDPFDGSHALSEALALSTYQFEGYKQKSNEPEKTIENITVYSEEVDEAEIKAALTVGYVYGTRDKLGSNISQLAREFINSN